MKAVHFPGGNARGQPPGGPVARLRKPARGKVPRFPVEAVHFPGRNARGQPPGYPVAPVAPVARTRQGESAQIPRESGSLCLILKKVDSQPDKKMYYLHTESQEKYFEDVIRLHKSGCSSRKIAKLLPVEKTTVSNWISIFVREKGQVMRVKRTEELVNPDGPRASEVPSKDEMEALRRRIKELESQLLQSEIKAEAYDEMIRVAESKFGIPIRKKAGAKQ